MRKNIKKSVSDSLRAVEQLQRPESLAFMETVAEEIALCYEKERKVLVAGNGGSLCDAVHFAEELTGIFRQRRRALPAIALSDPAHITCMANDVGFEEVFSRGVEAYGKKGDVFVGLTTSGNSPNIVRAFEEAKKLGLTTVAFLGKAGGTLKGFADHEVIIEGFSSSDRIQEAHMTAIHIVIEMVEYRLFPELVPFARIDAK